MDSIDGGGANEIVLQHDDLLSPMRLRRSSYLATKCYVPGRGPKVRKSPRFKAAWHIIRSGTFHGQPFRRQCGPSTFQWSLIADLVVQRPSPCGNLSEMIPVRVPTTGQK